MTDDLPTFYGFNRDGSISGEFGAAVRKYQQATLEGAYRAEWEFVAGDGATVGDLMYWFNNRMMHRIEAHHNGAIWAGYVYAMELHHGGTVRIKDMGNVANVVKVQFEVGVGGNPPSNKYTRWYKNQDSIDLYGPFPRIVQFSGEPRILVDEDGDPIYYDATRAAKTELEERAEVELARYSNPYQSMTVVPTETSRLHITAVGAMVLGDGVLLSDGELADSDNGLRYTGEEEWADVNHGDELTVGDEVRRICDVLEANSIYLFARHLEANDTLTAAGVDRPMGAVERLIDLTKLRNSAGEYYRLSIDHEGGITYEILRPREDYLFYANAGQQIVRPDGTRPTWDARPGFVHIIDDTSPAGLPGTWLGDDTYQFMERVEMRQGDEAASFHQREFDLGDVYQAIASNLRWIERNE